MTKIIIDNRATAKKAYEAYEIDRNEYKTQEELQELVYECLNENVYSITVTENGKEIIKVLNTAA
jgi:hypothetical protein